MEQSRRTGTIKKNRNNQEEQEQSRRMGIRDKEKTKGKIKKRTLEQCAVVKL